MTSCFLGLVLHARLFLAWLCLRAAVLYVGRAGRISWRVGGMVNIYVVSTATMIAQRADILRLAWQYPEICQAHKEWTSRQPSEGEATTFFPWRRSSIK
jgi:hypothetical protein